MSPRVSVIIAGLINQWHMTQDKAVQFWTDSMTCHLSAPSARLLAILATVSSPPDLKYIRHDSSQRNGHANGGVEIIVLLGLGLTLQGFYGQAGRGGRSQHQGYF